MRDPRHRQPDFESAVEVAAIPPWMDRHASGVGVCVAAHRRCLSRERVNTSKGTAPMTTLLKILMSALTTMAATVSVDCGQFVETVEG